jgi:hypothetical protein
MQFLVVLVVAALWVKYFWVFVAAVAGLWAVHRIARGIANANAEHKAAVDAETARIDGLLERADQKHNWRMEGDPRGMFGDHPPAL